MQDLYKRSYKSMAYKEVIYIYAYKFIHLD